MTQFERTADYPLLGDLLRNPGLYPFISDDFSPALKDAAAVEHPGIWYVLARDEEGLLGFFMLIPQSTILYDLHTVMPLDKRALAAMKELLGPTGWLWSNSPCLRVATSVHHPIAHRFGLRAGLTVFGNNPASLMQGGVLQDQILMGISKPKDK